MSLLRRLARRALLARYVQLTTIRAFALVAVTLAGLFSLLEFVEQLASVGEGQYHVRDAFIYVVLTAPSRLVQVTPISMLLGALLALGGFARNAELTAMLSLGVAERQVVSAVLVLTLPIAAMLFVMAEYVIPPAQLLAHTRRDTALSGSAGHLHERIWAHGGREFLHVDQFGAAGQPVGIDIYAFAPDGSLALLTHAERASIEPDGHWLLLGVSRRRVRDDQFKTEELASLPWQPFVPSRQLRFLALPIDSIPPTVLYGQVSRERRQQAPTRYDQEFWAKVDVPISVVAMIMISAPFVFGRVRTQSTGQRLAYGVGFGIVFSLVQQIIDHLGLLLRISPAATATGPSLAVIALAVYLLRDVYWPDAGSPAPAQPAAG